MFAFDIKEHPLMNVPHADLPGESRPARFEPAIWPPQVLPEPVPERQPEREPAEAPATPSPEREPVPA